MINSLGYTIFTSRASEVGKIPPFCRQIVFWSTLDAPREKTVHLRELVTAFKVVLNIIDDIIH